MYNMGQRLKELREERGLTLSQVSKLTSISISSLSRWEKNQADINGANLKIMAKFYCVTADYILGLSDF